MFDEMVERIQRTTISVLLKVKIEIRGNAPSGSANGASAGGNAANNAARRPFRRQMPEPIQNMSSYKEAQARAAANTGNGGNANGGENA